MSLDIKKIGLLANLGKPGVHTVLHQAVEAIISRGLEVYVDEQTVRSTGLEVTADPGFSLEKPDCDMWLVFGGDGTMLNAARHLLHSPHPVLGINLGRLGFLTSVNPDGLCEAMDMLLRGEFRIENRSMIRASGPVISDHHPEGMIALNDLVLSRVDATRMIEIRVRVNGQLLTDYRCDGLIVSSPTGSTAYSLAAGGPIVHPGAEVFTVTPICPHTLSNRSVILGLDSRIEVTSLSSTPPAMLTSDGQESCEMEPNRTIVITRAENPLRLIQLKGHQYFNTLRQKLQWSGLHNDPGGAGECQ